MKGLIVKGIAGFYYVKDGDGKVTQCKARGIFKNMGITPYVGDEVEFEILDDGDGIINEILPRKNQFIRPPIANVDLFVIVVAAAKPKPNTAIIDKFLVMAEKAGTDIVLCINKTDIAKDGDIAILNEIYAPIYKVIFTSGIENQGVEGLKDLIKGKKVAFAGPSGVGKSTLINDLKPDLNLETGSISTKTKRGKHTTRHTEIFDLDEDTKIFDTPGFTSFDILEAEEQELYHYYPEMEKFKGKCKYDDCLHIKEPSCKIRQELEEGSIHQSRYDSYVSQIDEIRSKKKY